MLTRRPEGTPTRRPAGPPTHQATDAPAHRHPRPPARWPAGTPARRPALLAAGLALLLAVGAVPVLAAGAAPALADPGAECPPAQPNCSVWDDDPGTPGGGGNGGDTGGGNSGGGGGGGKCQWHGRTVPCYNDVLGWFNNGDGCYYKLAEPQPDAPDGQQWYVRTCQAGLGDQTMVLRDAPPPGFGTPPDPEEIARRVLATITIEAPRIAVAPRRSKGPGLVGLPVWMWGDNRSATFGPIPAKSDTDRGLTVTIRPTFNRIVWDMGDGEKVTCRGADRAGTEYRATGPYAGKPSPTCGYDGYQRPGRYRVGATTYWTVHWSGGGQTGQIPLTRTTGTVEIQINELQVVNR